VTITPPFAIAGVAERRPRTPVGTLARVDWHRLARLVTRQRATLGYSIAQLSATSGLSTSTLDSIEHARKTSYDPATLSVLERALRWRSGSVDRVLRGLEPLPIEDPDLEAIIAAWPKLSRGARRMLRILATEGREP